MVITCTQRFELTFTVEADLYTDASRAAERAVQTARLEVAFESGTATLISTRPVGVLLEGKVTYPEQGPPGR